MLLVTTSNDCILLKSVIMDLLNEPYTMPRVLEMLRCVGHHSFLVLFNNISCNALLLNQESQEKLFLGISAPLGKNCPYVS